MTRWLIFEDKICYVKQTFHIQHYSIYVFQMDLLHLLCNMLNWYEACLSTTNYPIFNMQDFRFWLRTSISDYFGRVVFPL